MTTYNQAIVALAQAGLGALEARASNTNSIKTAAAESHFLCSWMAQALKDRRFSKLVANDLTNWIRDGRSKGAGAQLKSLLERIQSQYLAAEQNSVIGASLIKMISELEQDNWLVTIDREVTAKLKLLAEGRNSLVISVEQYKEHIQSGQIIRPVTLYVRSDEQLLAKVAAKHGLLLSQGNKKASLIKYHKVYQVYPNNQQPALALLVDL